MERTLPNTQREHEIWRDGATHERQMISVNLIKEFAGDKLEFIEKLKQAANQQEAGTEEAPPDMWLGYQAALRDVLLILKSAAKPVEVYMTVINPAVPRIPDVDKQMVYKGH